MTALVTLLQQQAMAEPSLVKTVSVFLFMLCGLLALAATALDGEEERRETDGPLREAAPDCYDERGP